MPSPNAKSDQATRGFTLIEVLIATGIAAVALVVFFQSFSLGAQATDRTQNMTLAALSAESLMDRFGNDIPLQNGEFSGITDLGFDWQAIISPHEQQATSRSPSATLHTIALSLSWLDNGVVRSVDFSTIKIRLTK